MMRGDLFPVFLKLSGRPVLVVGGGAVAASKLASLQHARAEITVVSPVVAPAIARSGARIVARRFRASDLDGQWFVVSAAPASVNRAVARAAARRRVFVNAVDDPAHADAYLGGVVRRAGVTVAVSTGGRAPALAGLVREGLDALLPDDIGSWLRLAQGLRRRQRRRATPMGERRPALLRALVDRYAGPARERSS